MPPGRSAFSECDQVASPTVSITASTRSGSRAPDSNAWCRAELDARGRRLASSRLVTHTRSPAAAAERRPARSPPRRRRPAPAPCRPAASPDWVNSIRYAVSHAVGRQAASSKISPAGLGTRLRRGTTTRSASVPWCTSDSSERRGSSVSSPGQPGIAIDGVHDDLVAVLVDAGAVAAEDHRQPVRRQPDALQAPQVVVVERGGRSRTVAQPVAAPPGRAARRPPGRTAGRRRTERRRRRRACAQTLMAPGVSRRRRARAAAATAAATAGTTRGSNALGTISSADGSSATTSARAVGRRQLHALGHPGGAARPARPGTPRGTPARC